FSPARAPGPFSRLGDLDDGLHRRRMDLADDREPAPRPERVAVGLALAGQHPRREALALHVVRRAVAPGPLDRAAPMDVDGLVGADLPGDPGSREGLDCKYSGHEGDD